VQELKNILARQPGPEVAEQLSAYQGGLREKTKQMKAMASELNMYQAQARAPPLQALHALVLHAYVLGNFALDICEPPVRLAAGAQAHWLRTRRLALLHAPRWAHHTTALAKHAKLLKRWLQVNEYKYEIERLMRELADMKRRYFEQKRREQAEAASRAAAAAAAGGHGGPAGKLPALANPSQTRFTGGGFSLAMRP
jgi:hypothetical protein